MSQFVFRVHASYLIDSCRRDKGTLARCSLTARVFLANETSLRPGGPGLIEKALRTQVQGINLILQIWSATVGDVFDIMNDDEQTRLVRDGRRGGFLVYAAGNSLQDK